MSKTTIYEELAAISLDLHVPTGEQAFIQDDGTYKVTTDSGERIIAEADEVVHIEFTEELREQMATTRRKLMMQRGVYFSHEIVANLPEVAAIVKTLREAHNKRGNILKRRDLEIYERQAITAVSNVHQGWELITMTQAVLFTMLKNDLFVVNRDGAECRFPIEIPETYWDINVTSKPSKRSLDDMMFTPIEVRQPRVDKTSPAEQLIATVMTFLSEYKELNSTLTDIAGGIIELAITASSTAARYSDEPDDLALFRSELLSTLPPILQATHLEGEGGHSGESGNDNGGTAGKDSEDTAASE